MNTNDIYTKWFEVAKKVYFVDKEYSKKIVDDILKFKQKTKTTIPLEVKRFICKKCHSVLIPGINLRVRLNNQHLVYLCLECKNIYRIPYLKEKITRKEIKKIKEKR